MPLEKLCGRKYGIVEGRRALNENVPRCGVTAGVGVAGNHPAGDFAVSRRDVREKNQVKAMVVVRRTSSV